MCDVVDKVSFAEVDGDLSIGGALLEDPGALLLARARHPHPRRNLPPPHITSAPGHIWSQLHSVHNPHTPAAGWYFNLSPQPAQHAYSEIKTWTLKIGLIIFAIFWNWHCMNIRFHLMMIESQSLTSLLVFVKVNEKNYKSWDGDAVLLEHKGSRGRGRYKMYKTFERAGKVAWNRL